ncbi:MAG: alpha/beta hydrolase [Gammaproteobacteria bacterium]|jgi:pimeloyl-ACP methyl ester carboxylesterase
MSTTLLLVHGGWSADWVWAPLSAQLESVGVSARTIDLPGHGRDRRRMWSVTLADYADAVVQAADAIDGPVAAVGHSSGGFVVSAAAGRSPESFNELVYLAGFLPVHGERLIQLALKDKDSRLGPGIRPNFLSGHVSLSSSVCHEALFHDCSKEDEVSALQKMQNNPLRPVITKIKLDDRFNAVPKTYIQCTEDRALTPAHQKWMAERSGVPITHKIRAGHMPMFAATSDLASVLSDVANGQSN